MDANIDIRRWDASERKIWEKLFREYVFDFYKMSVTDEAVDSTWSRILKGDGIYGYAACHAEKGPVGLVHYMPQITCWSTKLICYLEDLFVSPEMRGGGIAHGLIEKVYSEAKKNGWEKVYWETQEFNHLGRILYDEVATKSDFIVYEKEIEL
jgi:GNAT superfamily N-acetyltransferase